MFDTFVVPDLLPAAPELFLAFMALVILLVDLGVKDSRRTLTFVATVLTLVACALIQLPTMDGQVVSPSATCSSTT